MISSEESMVLITKTFDQTRRRGHTHSLRVQILHKPWVPCAYPPASLLFSRLSGLEATEPTLSCLRFFSFSTQVSPVFDIAYTILVQFHVLLRLSSRLPDPFLVPIPVPILVRVPISATALVSVPAPAPVPTLCLSTGLQTRPRSRSRPVPAPSSFPSCASLFASTSVPVPTPSPSPSPLTSPFPAPSPTPFPSPSSPSTSIPPPIPFAPSRPLDPVTPSVRWACTSNRPGERSYWVPASATSCLHRLCSHIARLCSPPPPFPFSFPRRLCPRPHHRSRPHCRARLRYRLHTRPRHRYSPRPRPRLLPPLDPVNPSVRCA